MFIDLRTFCTICNDYLFLAVHIRQYCHVTLVYHCSSMCHYSYTCAVIFSLVLTFVHARHYSFTCIVVHVCHFPFICHYLFTCYYSFIGCHGFRTAFLSIVPSSALHDAIDLINLHLSSYHLQRSVLVHLVLYFRLISTMVF